ncbi:MAG: hypothetical protein H7Y10_12155 [Flavobacterium sp.]|nr:hypothetical protein [Flavobacterium sp.]
MEATTTKYHPILFSTPMVQAILEGRKTQTRRIVKYPLQLKGWLVSIGESENPPPIEFCPYEVGDVLWVRETFAEWPKVMFQYKASTHIGSEIGKWKPSIFMPKEACRIFLKLKQIRVERLQDISEEDAIAEGVISFFNPLFQETRFKDYMISYSECREASRSFCSLWESINGLNSWNQNPFVWVYEFEQIEKPNDFIV